MSQLQPTLHGAGDRRGEAVGMPLWVPKGVLMHWTCKWEAVGVTHGTEGDLKSAITAVLYWCPACNANKTEIVPGSWSLEQVRGQGGS